MSREFTNMLYEMMDDDIISSTTVAEMCLQYMSEDEVEDMMRANDIIPDDEDDEE